MLMLSVRNNFYYKNYGIIVTPQDPLQGRDSHFTPQT